MTCLAICAAMRPSGVGVLVEAEFAADLDLGRQLAGLVQRHLVDLVFDLLGRLDDGLVDISANLAGLAVHLGAHVLLRLVVLARGQRDRVFHGADTTISGSIPLSRLNVSMD